MRKIALGAVASLLLLASPALAQHFDFGIGPWGPSIHVGPGHGYYGGRAYGPRAYYRDGYVQHRDYPAYRRSYRVYEYD